jgi:DNA polymerase-3 subunit delta'
MFQSGGHPDFFGISPDGVFIKIEQIRELISALSLKSYLGGRKVAVINDADAMNRSTANAFLKTLEEPPDNTVIILVTSNPSALLRTVISRCRVVPFVPMEPQKLAGVLKSRLGLSDDDALRAATLADGCVGKALGGLDDVKAIDDEAVKLMAQLAEMPADAAINFAAEWKERRKDLPVLLERMGEILRLSQSRNSAFSSGIMYDVLEKFGRAPGERVDECFDMLMESAPALKFNPNVPLFLEALIFNMQSVLQKGQRIGTT